MLLGSIKLVSFKWWNNFMEEFNDSQRNESENKVLQNELDVDVSSSAGPYPSPRPSGAQRFRKSSFRPIWLGVLLMVVILGLTWFIFQDVLSESEKTGPVGSTIIGLPSLSTLPDVGVAPDALKVSTPIGSSAVVSKAAQPVSGLEPLNFSPSPETDGKVSSSTLSAVTPAANSVEVKPTASNSSAAVKPSEIKLAVPKLLAPVKSAKAKRVEAKLAVPEPSIQIKLAEDKLAEISSIKTKNSSSRQVEISERWVVNISSTPDAAESSRILSNLLGQNVGGQVYAYETRIDGRLQHRIRVGFFFTKEEAEKVGREIKERYHLFFAPWAVRPTQEEENKYKN
ncbi:MAG: hypothetical protein AMR96_04690 [Candidatus Adiutrix intracellularis]|nr:MAG: hypothetical protein AMR96_04690 [Candidatus Adiutrix intracellularis]